MQSTTDGQTDTVAVERVRRRMLCHDLDSGAEFF